MDTSGLAARSRPARRPARGPRWPTRRPHRPPGGTAPPTGIRAVTSMLSFGGSATVHRPQRGHQPEGIDEQRGQRDHGEGDAGPEEEPRRGVPAPGTPVRACSEQKRVPARLSRSGCRRWSLPRTGRRSAGPPLLRRSGMTAHRRTRRKGQGEEAPEAGQVRGRVAEARGADPSRPPSMVVLKRSLRCGGRRARLRRPAPGMVPRTDCAFGNPPAWSGVEG